MTKTTTPGGVFSGKQEVFPTRLKGEMSSGEGGGTTGQFYEAKHYRFLMDFDAASE